MTHPDEELALIIRSNSCLSSSTKRLFNSRSLLKAPVDLLLLLLAAGEGCWLQSTAADEYDGSQSDQNYLKAPHHDKSAAG